MPMFKVKKRRAGSDSYGHVWESDGATVEIDDPDIVNELLAIPDGGFELVSEEPPPAPAGPAPDPQPGGSSVHHPAGDVPGAGGVVELLDPDAPATVDPDGDGQGDGEMGATVEEPPRTAAPRRTTGKTSK